MAGLTPDEIARACGLESRPTVAPVLRAIASADMPPLAPFVAAPVTFAITSKMLQSRCYEVHAPVGPVGLLVGDPWPAAHAVCAGNAWTFTVQRRGRLSWMGVAEDLRTGEEVAAFYPALFAGGAIALSDTHYRLTAPWLRTSSWLRDEDGEVIAVMYRNKPLAGRVELRHDSAYAGEQFTLVLLLALWVHLAMPRSPPGQGSPAEPGAGWY